MAFSLFIRDLFLDPHSKIWAPWLEQEPLANEGLKEIAGDGYRDRYAITSLGDLRALKAIADADEDDADSAGRFKTLMKGRSDTHPLVLHWEEWESGMS